MLFKLLVYETAKDLAIVLRGFNLGSSKATALRQELIWLALLRHLFPHLHQGKCQLPRSGLCCHLTNIIHISQAAALNYAGDASIQGRAFPPASPLKHQLRVRIYQADHARLEACHLVQSVI